MICVDLRTGHNIGDLRPMAENPGVAAVIVTIGEVVIINYIAHGSRSRREFIDHDRMPFSREIGSHVALLC